MTQSDSEDESVYGPSSDDDDGDDGTETLADVLERTRREKAAQREVEAEGRLRCRYGWRSSLEVLFV
jgi:hypothetical protein